MKRKGLFEMGINRKKREKGVVRKEGNTEVQRQRRHYKLGKRTEKE